MKAGVNFRRYDVSDHNFFNTYPTITFNDLSSLSLGGTTASPGISGLQAFSQGIAQTYQQASSLSTDVPIGLWGIGFSVEDTWKVKSNFTLTGALRFEHNANPTCNTNCFSNSLARLAACPACRQDLEEREMCRTRTTSIPG